MATTTVPLIPAEGRAWSMKSLARLSLKTEERGTENFAARVNTRQVSPCAR